MIVGGWRFNCAGKSLVIRVREFKRSLRIAMAGMSVPFAIGTQALIHFAAPFRLQRETAACPCASGCYGKFGNCGAIREAVLDSILLRPRRRVQAGTAETT